jgi:hypothetical protein
MEKKLAVRATKKSNICSKDDTREKKESKHAVPSTFSNTYTKT